MQRTAHRERAGRPSKGPRHASKVRFPILDYERYLAAAEARGLCFSDFIVELCAAVPPQSLGAAPRAPEQLSA